MPTYEFMCTDCGTKFSFSGTFEATLNSIPCPNCSSVKIKREYSVIPVIFKGKGFYKNDSRKGKNG
jgi:putative FmdB family regulatory protein